MIKFTLVGLVLLLIVILTVSFYTNQEGFEQMEKEKEEVDSSIKEGFADSTVFTPSGSVSAASTNAPLSGGLTIQPTITNPPAQVNLSNQSYDAMEKNQRASLLRDIQKVIRNELISNRSFDQMASKKHREDDEEEDSDSTAQGRDYKKNSFKSDDECSTGSKCDPLTDMTKYIRKDQIPCWGCNIDY